MTKQKNNISISYVLRIAVRSLSNALFLLLITAFWFSTDAEAYGVSGLVAFRYDDYESKIGDQRSSSQTFSQNYALAVNNYVWDPRFMQFTANIGYSMTDDLHSGKGSTVLSYGINTTFFPRRKIKFDAFANRSVNQIESQSNIVGYDIISSSYGATLTMSLSTMNRNGNRNNNNNNNNNFRGNGGRPWVLPDILLSYVHWDSESQNALHLIDESRDNTKVLITYRPGPRLDMSLDSTLEQYKNELTGRTYDVATAGIQAKAAISPRSALNVYGRFSDRTMSDNWVGYDSKTTTYSYGMTLNTAESARLRHHYELNRSAQLSDSSEITADRASAGVNYMITPVLQVNGALQYAVAENRSKATAVTSAQTTQQKDGALTAGAAYNETFTPEFIGPFMFMTSYAIHYGFSEISSTDPANATGRGHFYTNAAALTFASRGWDKETFSLGYHFGNKRDHSPANNDTMSQTFNLNLSTRRLSKTTIAASANYSVTESSSAFAITSITQSQTFQDRRTTRYNINATHATTQSLSFNGGATRSLSTNNTLYTLSTLSAPLNSTAQDEINVYAGAHINYRFTRNVLLRANVMETFRSLDNGTTKIDARVHSANMYIDYRMRMLFLNIEYRWQQDVPENAMRVTQQYFIAKLTRPF